MGRNFPNQKLILPTELATTLSCKKMQPSFTQSNYCGQVRTLHHEFRLHLHSPHHISWLNDTETKECQKEQSPLSFSSPSGRWEQRVPPGGEGTEGFTLLLSPLPYMPLSFPQPYTILGKGRKSCSHFTALHYSACLFHVEAYTPVSKMSNPDFVPPHCFQVWMPLI